MNAPAPVLPRLVRLAKLFGAKLPAGQEKGTATQWTEAMDEVWQRAGGLSGHAFGSMVEQVRDALKSLSDAIYAEMSAANGNLAPAARDRCTREAKVLRAEVDAALVVLEARIAELRAAVVVTETHVEYPALAPKLLVEEVLAERGLCADFSQRVKAADLKSFRAPLAC